MNKTINVYQTLNKREKYILNELGIKKDDFKNKDILYIIDHIYFKTKRISELPVTNEQISSAVENYERPNNEIFKGIDIIFSDDDYPDTKINMYNLLTAENRKTIRILGIEVENKEITSKEYHNNLFLLYNNLLTNFGTGIKKKECYELASKIINCFE